MPGVRMSKPGPLAPLCKLLLAALQETGGILFEAGHKSLAELLTSTLEGLKDAPGCAHGSTC
jgi:hypothetical protein